ncbi:hypothetical protein [Sandaracinus amylolyticus]|uniref:Uncharacterized protein n=1 Tax=Sandaracinus amylolyticus TaxID=927083 RepID=A0A0F6YGW0_9BACT|nr:hypothetical protein [Sandaracinus amylolyticus]AKF05147.1 hypothetical protein DB32_002296 [Sandaracinus amylolyticus]
MTTINAALLAAALLFVLFIVAQALLPALIRRRGDRASSAKMDDAILRANDTARPAAQRAEAFREGATIALDELRRPRLALRLLTSAESVAPGEPATIALVERAMLRAKDLGALERFLWQTMDAHRGTPAHARALDALLALYDGPMKTPERARVLRAMSAPRDATTERPSR